MKFTTILLALISVSLSLSAAIPNSLGVDKKCTDCGSPFSTDPCCSGRTEIEAEVVTKRTPFTDKKCTDCGSPFSADPCCFSKSTEEAIQARDVPAPPTTDKKCADCGSPFSTDPCCFGKEKRDSLSSVEEGLQARDITPTPPAADKKYTDCGSPFSTDPCYQGKSAEEGVQARAESSRAIPGLHFCHENERRPECFQGSMRRVRRVYVKGWKVE
jgi:hypothetical protein